MAKKLIAVLIGSLFAIGALSGSIAFAEDKKDEQKKEEKKK